MLERYISCKDHRHNAHHILYIKLHPKAELHKGKDILCMCSKASLVSCIQICVLQRRNLSAVHLPRPVPTPPFYLTLRTVSGPHGQRVRITSWRGPHNREQHTQNVVFSALKKSETVRILFLWFSLFSRREEYSHLGSFLKFIVYLCGAARVLRLDF